MTAFQFIQLANLIALCVVGAPSVWLMLRIAAKVGALVMTDMAVTQRRAGAVSATKEG